MSSDDVPENVRALLRDHLESFEQLELLLFLKQHPDVRYSAKELASHCEISLQAANDALGSLTKSGFVKSIGTEVAYVYSSAIIDKSIDHAIGSLSTIYSRQNLAIIRLMATNSVDRVRAAALRAFTDSFIIRKGKDRG
jgi:predicted transcriptional regulator